MLVARLSFSGERAYEVYCGADHALAVWGRLLEAGAELRVVPYGLEALGALRIEKGHVTGAEIDGRTTVHDLGLEKMFSKKKEFVGKPLALRPALVDPGRKQLVGAEVARRQAGPRRRASRRRRRRQEARPQPGPRHRHVLQPGA